jgi:uncharacterized protein
VESRLNPFRQDSGHVPPLAGVECRSQLRIAGESFLARYRLLRLRACIVLSEIPMRTCILLWAAVIVTLQYTSMAQTSFDCIRAGSTVEKVICADPAIASLDKDLAESFQQAAAKAGTDGFLVRADEHSWLTKVNDECDNSDAGGCIRQALEKRISELKSEMAIPGLGVMVYRLTRISRAYDFEVRMLAHVPENLDDYREGPAKIVVSRKGAASPFQTINVENIFVSLGKDGKPLTNIAPLYGDQGFINVGDFNFDGHDDFAIQVGNQGSYGLPNYSVFLYSTDRQQFSLSQPLSELTRVGLGFFSVDSKKKHLTVLSKSGCCYHESTEYKVEHDAPIPVSRDIEDGTIDKNYLVVSHQRYVDGEWQGTEERLPMPQQN